MTAIPPLSLHHALHSPHTSALLSSPRAASALQASFYQHLLTSLSTAERARNEVRRLERKLQRRFGFHPLHAGRERARLMNERLGLLRGLRVVEARTEEVVLELVIMSKWEREE